MARSLIVPKTTLRTKSLDALAVRQRRLEAERDGKEAITLPGELLSRLEEPDLASLWHTETRFFESRRKARFGLKAQLNERIMQFEVHCHCVHF